MFFLRTRRFTRTRLRNLPLATKSKNSFFGMSYALCLPTTIFPVYGGRCYPLKIFQMTENRYFRDKKVRRPTGALNTRFLTRLGVPSDVGTNGATVQARSKSLLPVFFYSFRRAGRFRSGRRPWAEGPYLPKGGSYRRVGREHAPPHGPPKGPWGGCGREACLRRCDSHASPRRRQIYLTSAFSQPANLLASRGLAQEPIDPSR